MRRKTSLDVVAASTTSTSPYSPTTPTDWPVVPGTIQQGLDDLAARATTDEATFVKTATVQTGLATLVLGTVTVATANITASSVIVPIRNQSLGTQGILSIANVVIGAPGSFDIHSTDVLDISKVTWLVLG